MINVLCVVFIEVGLSECMQFVGYMVLTDSIGL